MGKNAPRGHTGDKVREAGTYVCEDKSSWSYVPGDTFRECPSTGKPTFWEKSTEPHHPGGR